MAVELRPEDGDACEAFASEPLEELLHSFSEGQDGALVVCGPQRVRSLLGSTGSPGVLGLAMAQCANALPTNSLLAFSAFFALPEVEHQARCRLPCLDLMDGCRRACWEQCNIETFTDMHKAFSVLVRCCSALLDTRGEATRKWQQYQDCLGRLPLIFCLQLLRCSGSHPGVLSNRLFFVEAPPPVSGGPVPQHFLNATARLQMGRCVVLHAALGGAPSTAALRSALGPLQRLTQKDGKAQAMAWDLRPLCRAMVLQAEKAAQDIWQLCSLLRRCSEDEERLGSVGVPCCDAAKLWTASFGGIRQITLSELRRQYPLAVLRAKTLRTLLLSMQDWEDKAQEAALEEALELLKSFETVDCNRNGELLVEVAALTWQQQWQVRHLVGCIHAAEERDQLVGEVEDLTEDLVATQEELSSQQMAQQKDQQQRQASEEEWEWQLHQEREKCEDLAAQLAMSQEDVSLLRQQLVQLEALLADERPRTPETPAAPAEKKTPRRKQSDWQMQERVKELEALVGQLQREQKEDREMLRATCAHRDRLQLQLRREATAAAATSSSPRSRRDAMPALPVRAGRARAQLHASRSTQSSSKESSTVAAELVSPTMSPL